MWTFTIDPTLFATPSAGYEHVQAKRAIGEVIRTLKKRGLLHSDRYFCVLEWQKNGWPHWHVLVDADFIPIEIVQERWNCFRPNDAGPVESGRPGFGFVFVSKRDFESPDHAANYACKYITKHPENGFPEWVLESRGEVKRYWASKGFYDCLPRDVNAEIRGDEPDDTPSEEGMEVEEGKKLATTIRERVARCGQGVALFERTIVQYMGGERYGRNFVERWPWINLEKVGEVLGLSIGEETRSLSLGLRELKKFNKFVNGPAATSSRRPTIQGKGADRNG